jgi:hypothetical protein
MKRILLAFGLLLAAASGAFAQTTPVSPIASRLDASVALQGQSAGAASCNAVSATIANDTVTITVPAGLYAYITGIYITKSTDATGVTEFQTVSATNLSGTPIWDTSSTLNTTGQRVVDNETFATPLKSSQPGVNVTFVPSANQSGHGWLCMKVAFYLAP